MHQLSFWLIAPLHSLPSFRFFIVNHLHYHDSFSCSFIMNVSMIVTVLSVDIIICCCNHSSNDVTIDWMATSERWWYPHWAGLYASLFSLFFSHFQLPLSVHFEIETNQTNKQKCIQINPALDQPLSIRSSALVVFDWRSCCLPWLTHDIYSFNKVQTLLLCMLLVLEGRGRWYGSIISFLIAALVRFIIHLQLFMYLNIIDSISILICIVDGYWFDLYAN